MWFFFLIFAAYEHPSFFCYESRSVFVTTALRRVSPLTPAAMLSADM